MIYFTFILASLTTWRIAELVVYDSGPFHLFKKWRDLWKKHPYIHELFTCPYCCSGWVSIGVCLVLWKYGHQPSVSWLIYYAAVWGGAMLILRTVRERE